VEEAGISTVCTAASSSLPLHPAAHQAVAAWNPDTAGLTLTLPTAPSAALLRITRTESDAP